MGVPDAHFIVNAEVVPSDAGEVRCEIDHCARGKVKRAVSRAIELQGRPGMIASIQHNC